MNNFLLDRHILCRTTGYEGPTGLKDLATLDTFKSKSVLLARNQEETRHLTTNNLVKRA